MRDVALRHRSQSREELSDTEAQLAQINEAQVGQRDRVNRTTVVSPVTGFIKRLSVNTVGGVIQPGMDILAVNLNGAKADVQHVGNRLG